MHLVAHGRPGAIQLGGRWLSRRDLIAGAAELGRWQLRRIALWSCELGQDPALLALLAELSGAEIWASDQRLGAGHWRLRRHGACSARDAAAGAPTPPFDSTLLSLWPHHLDATMDDSLDLYNLSIGSGEGDAVDLLAALQQSEDLIASWLRGEDALQNLYNLFGGGGAHTSEWEASAQSFIDSVLSGGLSLRLELRSNTELSGAYGAFAAAGADGQPTIYLNEYWVSQLSLADLTRLILEETGHWIDSQINGSLDSAGDEGEAFAATVLGTELSEAEWIRIRSENDSARLLIDGVEVAVELASLAFISPSTRAFYISTGPTGPDPSQCQLETNVPYVNSRIGDDNTGFLFISVPASDPIFSGNNTRGWLYAFDKTTRLVSNKWLGEITRLYKTPGNTIPGLQFYVYPSQSESYVANRTTYATSILLDIGGAGFQTGQYYTTSSDPVSTFLNSLLPTNTAPVAVNDTDRAFMDSCSTSQVLADASGNVLTGVGTDADPSGADSDPNDWIYDPSGGGPLGTVNQVSDVLVVKTISSDPTKDSNTVAAGTTSANGTLVQGTYGTLRIGANGSYLYDVDENNAALIALGQGVAVTDVFTYQVADSQGLLSSATLTITIVGGNDGPTAVNDYEYLKEGLTIPAAIGTTDSSGAVLINADKLLLNDSDPDTGDTLRITFAAKADNINDEDLSGSVAIGPSGISTTVNPVEFAYNGASTTSSFSNAAVAGAKIWLSVSGTYTDTGIFVKTVDANKKNITFGTTSAGNAAPDGYLYLKATDSIAFTTAAATLPPTNTSGGTVTSVSGPGTRVFVIDITSGTPTVGAPVTGQGVPGSTTLVSISPSDVVGAASKRYVTLSSSVTIDTTAGSNNPSAIDDTGDSLTFISGAIFGNYGYLNLKSDGSYTYVQTVDISANTVVDEYFSYQITDGSGCTDTAVLHLEIQGAPPSPPTMGADSFDVIERGNDASGNVIVPGTSPASGNVLSNDILDPSGASASVTRVWRGDTADSPLDVSGSRVIAGAYGDLTIDSSGNVSYALNNEDADVQALRLSTDILTDEFYYEILESDGDVGVTTLKFVIKGTNDGPVANNDTVNALEAGGVANAAPGFDPTGNVLLNDTDVDAGDTKSVLAANQGQSVTGTPTTVGPSGETAILGLGGTLYIKKDGTYRYVVDNNLAIIQELEAGESLQEDFSYRMVDASGVTSDATLTIQILGADDQLLVSNVSVNEGSPWAVFIVRGLAGELVTLELDIDGSGVGYATKGLDFGDPSGIGTGLQYWNGSSWVDYPSSTTQQALDASGNLYVRAKILNDTPYEDVETFLLKAKTSDNNISAGVGAIFDDGTGSYFGENTPPLDGSGNLITEASGVLLDDDRPLAVSGNTYNEKAGYIFWTVSGAAGQIVKLVGLVPDSSGASLNDDLSGNLQYRDTSGNWRTLDASAAPVLDASGNLLVRQAVINDSAYEGKEDFKLIVQNTGGTDASGRSSLIDDGTGLLPGLDQSGNPTLDASGNITDSSGVKDDDRTLTVSGNTYNEAAGYIFWTVSGAAGQIVKLVGLTGDSSGASVADDLSGNLQYRDLSGNWQTFDPSAAAVIDPSGSLLIRQAVINDSPYEGKEDFRLIVENTGGTDASGRSSIIDDGTGLLPTLDGSGNPTRDASGNITDSSGVKNDDRAINVVATPNVSEGSNAIFTITLPDGNNRNTEISLSIPAPSPNSGAATPGRDYADASGTAYYFDACGNAIPLTITGGKVILPAGISAFFVKVPTIDDIEYEISEDFSLQATITGGLSDFDKTDIRDDGSGNVYKDDGTVDPSGIPDNDLVDVVATGGTYNEASPYAIYTLSGIPNELVDASGLISPLGTPRGYIIRFIDKTTQEIVDEGTPLQPRALYSVDGGQTWLEYSVGSVIASPGADKKVLIAVDITAEQDTDYEISEVLEINVEDSADADTASADAFILDNGTGDFISVDGCGNPVFDSSANPVFNTTTPKDDDRPLTVTGATFNEKAGYIFWTVSGIAGSAGQRVNYISHLGTDPSDASVASDLSGVLQYRDLSGNWQTFDASSNAVLDASGTLLVRQIIVNDAAYEGLETFKLIVANTGTKDFSGNSFIIDDGTGLLPTVDGSGNPTRDPSGNITDSSGVKDDDRTLTVSGNTYNEAAGYIFWTVSGIAGSAGQTVKLAGYLPDSSGASANDLSGNLQYRDLSGNWQTFDPSASPVLDGSGQLIVRQAVINDGIYEGLEKFKLIVVNTGGTDAFGSAGIIDDGTGLLPTLDGSGNPTRDASGNISDSSGVKDDDRTLTVSGNTFNEAAGYIFWTVSGAAGQTVKYVGLDPDSSGASITADLSGNLQYRDLSGNWRNFNNAASAVLDGSGQLLVRKVAINDSLYEGKEDFKLIVENTGGTDASGRSSLIDDGTGLLPTLDGSGNPTRDASGNITDSSGVKDDDRTLTVSGNTFNEGAGYIFWTVSGAAGQTVRFVSLTGDSSGASVNDDLSGNLQYRDLSGNWQTFDASAAAVIDPSGSLLIRQAVINDSPYEGKEDFKLIVENTGGTDASGRSSLIDDGTGLLPILDPSGNPSRDPSGNFTPDPSGVKDDDRKPTITISPMAYVGETDPINGNRLVNFSINLSKPSTSVITVNYSTTLDVPTGYQITGQSVAQQADFLAINNAVATFQPGATALNFSTTVVADLLVEGTESYFLRLSNASVNAQIGSGNSEVVILDNDPSNNLLFDTSGSAVPMDLRGGTGNDTLIGGSADDILYGDPIGSTTGGADWLTGGLGADQMTGGPGADRFVYRSLTESTRLSLDRIRDFSPASGDRIVLPSLPSSLWNRGVVAGQSTLLGAVNAAYADRDASGAINPLGANQAVLFAYDSTVVTSTNPYSAQTVRQWFIAVNDGNVGRSDTDDLLINVSGLGRANTFASSAATTPGLTVTNFFTTT
ncbi:MAG: VCBS domain-containing protein [Cyanobacteriota bacterium]|nr:VCBS domain-containing protein [Cyanobacteriota bacterium]